ncbi:MAG: hypothetical protein HUU57_04955 [Bdellovibrio sp.]|nr:hypothetical protein [Bdellovibrio sp.]
MRIHFFVFLLFLTQDTAWSKPTVEASVYSESQVNRFRRKVHPFQLGECMGQDTEISNETLKNILEKNGSSGSVSRTESRGDQRIGDFYFGNIEWNIEVDPDENLKIHFSQSTITSKEEVGELRCNTTVSKSNVLASSTKFSGSVLLVVPRNVFVLRIRQSELSNTEASASFSSKIIIVNRTESSTPDKPAIPFESFPSDTNKLKYLFVRPGDLVRLSVEYKTDSVKKVDFSSQFEVGFLGSFRCNSKHFDIKSVDFKRNLLNSFAKVPTSPSAMDDLLVKASCLQNPLFSRELLINSHGSTLATLIRQIAKSQVSNPSDMTPSTYFYNIVMSYLALDLSKNVVSDLKLFCDTAKLNTLFSIPSDFEVLTRKYHWASLNYIKIKYTLDQTTPPAVDAILDYLSEQQDQKISYSYLRDAKTLAILREYTQDVLSDKLTNFSNISDILKEIPNTLTGQNIRNAYLKNVKEAHSLAIDFQYQIQSQLRKIGTSSNDLVNIGDLKSKWEQIKKLNTSLLFGIQQDLKWFEISENNPTSSKFVSDLYDLNSVILTQSHILNNSVNYNKGLYKSLVENNPEFEPLFNHINNETFSKSINKCLDSSHE